MVMQKTAPLPTGSYGLWFLGLVLFFSSSVKWENRVVLDTQGDNAFMGTAQSLERGTSRGDVRALALRLLISIKNEHERLSRNQTGVLCSIISLEEPLLKVFQRHELFFYPWLPLGTKLLFRVVIKKLVICVPIPSPARWTCFLSHPSVVNSAEPYSFIRGSEADKGKS